MIRNEVFWFFLALIINLLLVLLYLFVNIVRKKEKAGSYWMRATVMLLCPIVGILYYIFSWIYWKLFFRAPVDLEDVVFSKDRVKTYLKADEASEMNLVPIEEAIAITDKESTRNLVLEVVRRDVSETLGTIMHALNSDDSEISHYAASVLQQELNKFRSGVQRIYLEIEEIQNDEEMDEAVRSVLLVNLARELFTDMNKICSQKVFSESEKKTYVDRMEEMIQILDDHFQVESDEIAELCMRLLEICDFERCDKWCLRNKQLFPSSLSAYTSMLRLYYTMDQKEQFFAVLNELKSSQIPIDHDTLEMIRVFL